jgi:predicted nucleic acid-binding protein
VIVVDASAVVEYLTDGGGVGEWVRARIEHESELAAPHLLDLEVLSAIRKRLLRKEVTRPQARDAIADFEDLALVRYPVTDFMSRIWALRATLTPYDASYVVLAEALGSTLITTDARLARSRGHRAEIVTRRASA